jgi:mannose-6-phosphate isomerase-like protein (cupin superfamily)
MELSPRYVLPPGATRRDDAILPFKALAADTGGVVSVLEFELGPWESGSVLHVHDAVDEAFYVLSGRLEAQLDEERLAADRGSFVWVPRGTRHAFANGGPDKLHVLGLGMPGGGIEELFAEQAAYFAGLEGPPILTCCRRSAGSMDRPLSAHRFGRARLPGRRPAGRLSLAMAYRARIAHS